MFWDRAPWHRGKAIDQVLSAHPRLEIMWYPVAAPELNPQEQVWKATRRAVSHNHTEAHLEPLADQFENHLLDNALCFIVLGSIRIQFDSCDVYLIALSSYRFLDLLLLHTSPDNKSIKSAHDEW